jgi:hypothetical protein
MLSSALGGRAAVGYQSDVRLRKPCIMLVGIDAGAEPAELGLEDLAGSLRVVRVRYPLPACERMLVVRPLVVILGQSVREWALPVLEKTTKEIDATLLQLGPLVVRDALRDWLRRALETTMARRLLRRSSG